MMRPMTQRQREILIVSMRRWIAVEKEAGNTVAVAMIEDLKRDVDRQPLRVAS